MSLIDFLLLLLVAGLCGGIAQALVGFTRGGCLVSIGLGFIGALVGVMLARLLDLPAIFVASFGGASFPIVWSILGASIFLAVIGLLRRHRTA